MTRFRASIFFIFITIFSCLHSESNAADVYFNDVYPILRPTKTYSASSGSGIDQIDAKIIGRNFKFHSDLNTFSASGNDISGTFSYFNESGLLVTIPGTISRPERDGSTTRAVYFWNANEAYIFVIPGYESFFKDKYDNGNNLANMIQTDSSPVGNALDNAVAVTPQIIVSATSLSPFVSCVGSVSDYQTFTVSGTNLPANLTIVPPNGFEVSTNSTLSYTTSTLTITPVSNTVTTTTIYVRLPSSNPIGAYSNQFIISSSTSSSTTSNIANTTVSGTVYGTPSLTIIETDASGDASNDAIICNGGSVTLTASGTTTYLWSTNSTSSTITLSPSSTTTYTVTGTTGCSVTASITITVTNTAPVLTIISTETSGNANNDDIICIGGSVTLTASGTTSFLWSSGAATTSSITITPSSSTTYTVTGTTSGCSNTASKTITVNALPIITNSGATTNVDLVSLTASGGTTYAWSDGSSITSTTNTFDASGLYSLTVVNEYGCISSTLFNITVQHWGLSRNGEKTLDSAIQISSNGKIASLNPLSLDGKIREYKTSIPSVTIGSQIWTNKNLDVTTYRNGDPIPQVTDPTAWAALTTGAWCYYNNDQANGAIYGKLYNWYAVNDPRGLAPQGWHVPSDAEWTTLGNNLGGNSVAGGKMKSTGTTYWTSPNTGATNSSGFSALPSGARVDVLGTSGAFEYLRNSSPLWTSTGSNSTSSFYRYIDYNSGILGRWELNKAFGFSVRLIKD